MTYICANCGTFAKDSTADVIDSGTVLTCNECGKETVVDLNTPEQRSKLWREFRPEWFRERHQGYKPAGYSGTAAQDDSTL